VLFRSVARRAQQSRSPKTKVRRKDRGMAGNGGQFAATRRAETAVRVETSSSEVADVVVGRLRSQGITGDPDFANAVARGWDPRFYPDALTAHCADDQPTLRVDLHPWRVLATSDDVQSANEESRDYVEARRSYDADIQGAKQVVEATDQMFVEIDAEDSRRRRE